MKKYMIFILLLIIPILAYANENITVESVIPKYDLNNKIIVGSPEEGKDFNVTLTGDNQQITYELTIKNTSGYDMNVNNIYITTPEKTFLSYDYSGLENNKILKDEVKIININIETKDNIELNTKDELNFRFDYQIIKTSSTSDDENNDEEENKTDIKEKNPYTRDYIYIAIAVILLSLIFYLFIKKKNKVLPIFLLFFLVSGTLYSFANSDEKGTFNFSGTLNIENIPDEEICRLDINPNGGTYANTTETTSFLVKKGTEININDTYRNGYVFVNWLVDEERPLLEDHIIINKDTILKATWEEEIYYQITIDPNGGVYNNSTEQTIETVLKNTNYTLNTPTKEDYIFLYWMDDEDNIISNPFTVTKNITIRAIWTEPIKYNVTINPNGGKYNNSEDTYTTQVLAGTVINLENISRTGYDFVKWNLNDEEDYTSPSITVINQDITLTAVWELQIFYHVEIDPNGGLFNDSTEVYTAEIKKDTIINIDISREGHSLEKWTLNDTEEYIGKTIKITKDTKLVANWIEAVARINTTTYPSISAAESAAKANDTIVLLKNTSEIVTNTKTVTIDLNSYKVTGSITNNGNLTIINGTIENPDGAAIYNYGTLTMGINDLVDEEPNVSLDSVAIIGTNIGLQQEGTFNFYDGYIEGIVAINGGYNSTPSSYIVYIDHNDTKNCQKAYLIPEPEDDDETNRAVAKTINGGVFYYFNLQDAINTSALTEYKIYAIRNFEAAYQLSIPEETTIIFDVDGYNVNTGYSIINNGTFTIKDSKNSGSLNVSVPIENNNSLILNNVLIKSATNNNVIKNNSSITMINSTIIGLNSYGIYNTNNATINPDETSVIKSNKYGLYNDTTLELSSGNIYGIQNAGTLDLKTGAKIYNNNSNNSINNTNILNINGATISSSSATAIVNTKTVVMNSGIVNVSTNHNAFYQENGNLTINNGTITTYGASIRTQLTNKVIINGGTITSTNDSALSFGLYYGVSHEINGGTIIGKSYGIYTNEGTCNGLWCDNPTGIVTMTNGYVKGNNHGAYLNSRILNVKGGTIEGTNYGIYIGNKATLNLGTQNNILDNTNPIIIGGTYGVYNSGPFNMYDGIIKGKTNGRVNDLTTREDGSVLYSGTEIINSETYKVEYLIQQPNFLEVNDVEYNSFTNALAAISLEGTIKVINDSSIATPVEIASGKTITLDLNNHTLTMSQTITNKGTLTITDTSISKGGMINNISTYAINNNSIIYIENGKLQSTATYALYSYNATYTMNDGMIESTSNRAAIYQRAGTGTINDGTIKGYQTGLETQYAAKLTMNDGEIISTNSYGAYFGLYYSANITINGGTITGQSYGIYTTDGNCDGLWCDNPSGTVYITGGTITGTNYYGANIQSRVLNITGGTLIGGQHGANIGSKATINIGNDDGTINSSSPILIGGTYGLSSSGTASFYDGILKGKTAGYSGTFARISAAAIIYSTTETINTEEYKVNYLQEQEPFLQVDDEEYNSLQKAIDAISETGTITLIDTAATGAAATIPNGKTITFDINGNELTMSQTINNNGNLTMIDSSTSKSGLLKNTTAYGITNNSTGVLIINGASITDTSNYAIYNNTGNLTLETGTVSSSSTHAIYNYNSTFTMNGGTVLGNGSRAALYQRAGTGTINGGTISSTSSNAIMTQYAARLTINDGTFTSTNSSAAEFGLYYSAVITINNGTFTGGYHGLYLYEGNCDALWCDNPSGTVYVNGGTITGPKDGIYIYSRVLNITGGTVTGGVYGIEVQSKGTANIGTNDETVSTTSPVITGETYGIYISGLSNYYDGILKGKTDTFNGVINSIPENYEITTSIEDGYKKDILEICGTYIRNSTQSKDYNNIQTAFNEANTEDTIILTKDYYLRSTTTISNDKELTFDLNGHSFSTNKTIANNGILTITNFNTNDATLNTNASIPIITNNGTLNISNIEITNNSTSQNAIDNNGTLEINNIEFNGANGFNNTNTMTIEDSTLTSSSTAIKNSGTMTVTNDEITGNSYAIYDSSSSTSTVEDTTLTSNSSSIYVYNAGTINANEIYSYGPISAYNSSSKINITDSTLYSTMLNNGTSTLTNSEIIYEVPNTSSNTYNVISNSNSLLLDNNTYTINKNNTINNTTRTIYNTGTINTSNTNEITINNINTYGTLFGIYTDGGTINEYKGNISIDKGNTSYGIYSNKGSISYIEGNIEVLNAKTSYGIYVNTGEAILGTKTPSDDPSYGTSSAMVSTTNPSVLAIGSSKGIGVKKETGYFKYYDGIIEGSTSAKPDTTTEVEYNYEVTFYTNPTTNNQYCILEYLK